MKYISKIIALLVLAFGCTEVVDVDLDTAVPKLVIEAFINWQELQEPKCHKQP
jgi:hypothetical protein